MCVDIDAIGLLVLDVRVAVVDAGNGMQCVEIRAQVGAIGEPGRTVDAVAKTDPQRLNRLSRKDLQDYVHTAVRSFVAHQVDEHLLVNGERCVDPHPREPNGFDAQLPAPVRVS